MAITLGLVDSVDDNGVYVRMPGSRGLLRGPFQHTGAPPVAGETVLMASVGDETTPNYVIVGTVPQRGFYGTIAMDGLAELRIGDTGNYSCSIMFEAAESPVVSFRAYWMGDPPPVEPGYAAGTGGVVNITVQSDLDGVPAGDNLGGTTLVGVPSGFNVVTFDTPVPLAPGRCYHIVMDNVDADVEANFASIDCARVETVTDYQSRPGRRLAALFKTEVGQWEVSAVRRPIVDVEYGNGEHQGLGYMEVEPGSTISGSEMVRERFTVSGGDRIVNRVGVRVAHVSGADDLQISVETSDGITVGQVTADISGVPTLPDPADDSGGAWVSEAFDAPLLLRNGQTYHLTLSIPGTSELWTRGIQKGGGYGFTPATYFADGVLEISADSGATWGYVEPGLSSWGDLQFYFL